MIRVAIVPFGDVAQADCQEASEALKHTYGVDTVMFETRPLPLPGYDEERDQYDVASLLDRTLDGIEPGDGVDAVLGVTNADLYYRRREFVFGSSLVDCGRAVVSTHRFSDPGYRRHGQIRRQVIKQVGHAVGLDQCDRNCVMQFSSTVDELNRRPDRLCQSCHSALPDGLDGDAEPIGSPPPMSAPTFEEWQGGVRAVTLAPLLWLSAVCSRLPLVGRRFQTAPAPVSLGDWFVAVVGLCLTPLFWLFGAWIRAPTAREWVDERSDGTRRLVHGTVGALSLWVKLGVFAALILVTLKVEIELHPLLTGSAASATVVSSLGVFVLALILGVVEYLVLTGLVRTLGHAKRQARRQSSIE